MVGSDTCVCSLLAVFSRSVSLLYLLCISLLLVRYNEMSIPDGFALQMRVWHAFNVIRMVCCLGGWLLVVLDTPCFWQPSTDGRNEADVAAAQILAEQVYDDLLSSCAV